MIKLDAYDKKIIELLLQNSKEQVSAIGKKIRLKRENVNYKLNRLIKEGLIKEFNTILNEKKLGITHYTVFLQLRNLKEETEKKIIDYLKNHKYISWIGIIAGKWSLTFDIFIFEKLQLREVLKDLISKFGNFIDEYTVLDLQNSKPFSYKYLQSKPIKSIENQDTKKPKLDKVDYKILSLLNKNSRTNYVEISKKTNLTPNGIKKRIKNLEKTNIIDKYSITINFRELDYEWYGLQLKLTKFDEENLITFLKSHKKVIFYHRYIGAWDYDIGIIVRDSKEVREFINDLRSKFSDIIKITDVFLVLEEVSGYSLPEGIFNIS